MRQIAEPLLRAQKSNTIHAVVRLDIGDFIFTHDKTETCHNTNTGLEWSSVGGGRIMEVVQLEEPFKQTTKIVLNNFDKLLNDVQFKGNRCYVSWGAITEDGEFYSTTGVQFVHDQTMISSQGTLQCVLNCIGPMNFMAKDLANADYAATGTDTTGALVAGVLQATLDPYVGCKEFSLIYDNPALTDTDLWSVVIPGEMFTIDKSETRLNVLCRLLDMTAVYVKPGSEAPDGDGSDSLHLFTLSPSSQYTYSLKSYDHRFYVNSKYDGLIIPNEIIIKSDATEAAYYGSAKDVRSYKAFPNVRTEYVGGLISDHQATIIAQSILSNLMNAQDATSAILPMNCGQEIMDRITIEDGRSGVILTGVVGHIERVFKPLEKEPKYLMNVSFGKWYDPRKLAEIMGIGSGFIDTNQSVIKNGNGHILISPLASYSKSGSWYALDTLGHTVVASIGVGNSVTYKVHLAKGEYLLIWLAWISVASAGQEVYVDDESIYSVNNENTDPTFATRYTPFTVTSSGIHSIKFLTIAGDDDEYLSALSDISISNLALVGTPILFDTTLGGGGG